MDLNRCDIGMDAKDHHAESAWLAGSISTAGITYALLALDDSLRALVALQERQTAALERIAAALTGSPTVQAARIPRPRTPR